MFGLETLIDQYTLKLVTKNAFIPVLLKEAFDKVWHLSLFFELRKLRLSYLLCIVLLKICIKHNFVGKN